MDRDTAKVLYDSCERVLTELDKAELAIRQISDPTERASLLQALGRAMTEVLGKLRAPIVRQYPDLEPVQTPGEPDTVLDAEDLEVVSRLTPGDVELIEKTLMAECTASWRKVARIVGAAMKSLPAQFAEVPDGYYAQRVVALVDASKLESQGNLQHMRFSEVRLPHS